MANEKPGMSGGKPDYISKRERYERLRQSLLRDRSSFEAHWRELSDFFLPRRARFTVSDRNRGERRNQNIIDSTGSFAVRTLGSGLHAGLTSPARPWLKLTTPDPDLAEFAPVKEWLHIVTQRMLTVFLQSNLYNVLPTLYSDFGVFGTSAMAVLEDSKDLFRAKCFAPGSYALGLDDRDIVNTFMREYQMTVGQLVEQFGGEEGQRLLPGQEIEWENFTPRVKEQWDKGNYLETVDVCWLVQPNAHYDERKLRAKDAMPFASCHFEINGGGTRDWGFLRESGYRMFPVMAPRWEIEGEDTYGVNSPGIMVLGDVKQLQGMTRTEGKAIQKMVDPPLTGPAQLKGQKTSLLPGDITYLDVRESQQGLKPIHEVKPDLGAFLGSKQEVQYRINKGFYVDLFLMLANSDGMRGTQPITAREIDERHEEKLLALGPVLERTNDELLDPLVDRVFEMLQRYGGMPTPPREVQGVNLRVEYISLMSQAQKLVGVVGLDRFVSTVVQMAQASPEVLDKVKFTDVVDEYSQSLGINPRLIRSDEETAAIGQARQQAAQQQQQMEQMAVQAKATRDLSQSPMTGDTALQKIVDAAGVAG